MIQTSIFTIGKLFSVGLIGMQSVKAGYIDPNTGGMLFQILAVMFGVISGALLLFSGRIKGIYYRIRRRFQESEIEASEEDDTYQDDEA